MTESKSISTRVAWTGWDDHRFQGYWAFAELAGGMTYTGLLALSITGRRFSEDACEMLDDLAVVMSVADPRIWPNKATRTAASYGRTLSACCIANLCLEESVIGPWPTRLAAMELLELHAAADAHTAGGDDVERVALAQLSTGRRLAGFGVPFRPYDERLHALRRCVEKRGRAHLRFWSLQAALCEVLRRERGLEPNIAVGLAAVCLDMGLEPDEIALLMVALVQHVVFANAVEGARQAPAVLRRLPDSVIEYVGTPPRRSARAEKEAVDR